MINRERGHIPIRTHPLTTFITISPLTINTNLSNSLSKKEKITGVNISKMLYLNS
jgi:hypothetical protein